MSAPKVFGWCPGALRPMMSGDGLVVRIRAPMGMLTQEQATGIAHLAEMHGSGVIDLSSRANIQIRGVAPDTHAPLIDGLRDLGLIDEDVATETRRNVMIQPFWEVGDTTYSVAQALSAALCDASAPDLPGKFGFAVDCGGTPLLQDASADIRIERAADGLICRPDGAKAGIPVTTDTAARTAMDMAQWFLETGGASDGRGRMSQHVARHGAPENCVAQANLPAATRPRPGPMAQGMLVALEFGQMTSGTLASLTSCGALRLTPWRMIWVEGASEAPDNAALITDPQDPRLNVTTCTGAPGCNQALSSTRDIARVLAPHVQEHLHVSGCAKGCAHQGPSARTIVATGQGRFDLILDGRTTDTPTRRGLSVPEMISGEL